MQRCNHIEIYVSIHSYQNLCTYAIILKLMYWCNHTKIYILMQSYLNLCTDAIVPKLITYITYHSRIILNMLTNIRAFAPTSIIGKYIFLLHGLQFYVLLSCNLRTDTILLLYSYQNLYTCVKKNLYVLVVLLNFMFYWAVKRVSHIL